MVQFAVTVLGNNAALPAQGRHPTSQVLHYHDRNYLLDCGEGTQLQLQRYGVKTGRLNYAFITHLHGDHYFGLVGLLTSMHLNQRTAAFNVFGPEGLEEIIRLNFKYSRTELNYPVSFHVVDADKPGLVGEDRYLEFHTVPLNHRIPCVGYVFREKEQPAKFKKGMLEKHGVKGRAAIQALKRGEPVTTATGDVVPSTAFTLPQAPRAYAFLGDTTFHQPVVAHLRGVNTLYHESTFLNDEVARATERFHATAAQAATIAKHAGVNKLLLGHFSARHKDTGLFEQEARQVFENAVATKEGELYTV